MTIIAVENIMVLLVVVVVVVVAALWLLSIAVGDVKTMVSQCFSIFFRISNIPL